MKFCRLRSVVGCGDPDQDVFRSVLGIFHKDIEIAVLLEDTGVEQFILFVVLGSTLVRLYQIGIGIRRLRVLVEILHVGACRSAILVSVGTATITASKQRFARVSM